MLVVFQKSLCFNTANNFYTVAANYQRKPNEAAHDIVQEVFLSRYYTFFFVETLTNFLDFSSIL